MYWVNDLFNHEIFLNYRYIFILHDQYCQVDYKLYYEERFSNRLNHPLWSYL